MKFEVSPALLEKYRTSAPRYTSYPTAVDWKGDFDPQSYPELLARAAQGEDPLSVYVHLPFCAEMCLFCGCNVTITRSEERMRGYVDRLASEFETVRARGIGQRVVHQYHWGGGTPTALPPAEMERVQQAFVDTFKLAPEAEVAIEVDPRVTTPEQIELLARFGFNRVSLGLQDLDEKVQRAVKRVQSEEATRAIVQSAREAGMGSINIDLIYGLPHQTTAGFEATVDAVLDMRPDRVALFHYAHVPWMKKHQTAIDEATLPSSADKLTTFVRSIEQFQDAGYVYIGLDHFALPDDELARALGERSLHRNFMGYTTRAGSEMISLGVSAIGEVAGHFVQNVPHEPEYKDRIAAHGFATYRGYALSEDDKLRRAVILGLMCNGVLDKAPLEARFGIAFDEHFAAELAELQPLVDDGLVSLDHDALRLSTVGQLFMRNVALVFDRHFKARQARGESTRQTFSKTL